MEASRRDVLERQVPGFRQVFAAVAVDETRTRSSLNGSPELHDPEPIARPVAVALTESVTQPDQSASQGPGVLPQLRRRQGIGPRESVDP